MIGDKVPDVVIPAMLHVNKELREFALRLYKLCFSAQLRKGPIYFDVKRDLIHFGTRYCLLRFYGRENSLKEKPATLNLMRGTEASVSTETAALIPSCLQGSLKHTLLTELYAGSES